MKLCAKNINGQIVGIDIIEWTGVVEPFIIVNDNDVIPENYNDISSITNWKRFSPNNKSAEIGIIDLSIQIGYENLSDEEKRIVDDIGKYYLIHKYLTSEIESAKIPPYHIDYDIIGLHKKIYFNKGELYRVEYYGEYNPLNQTYDKLCVSEDRTYYRQNRMLHRREMVITWYYNDGTSGATKNTTKYYTAEEAIAAGEVRRRNVITELKTNTVGLIMMTSGINQTQAENLGLSFLEQYNSSIFKYIEGAESMLKNNILTDTNHSWLDNIIPNTGGITIRLYLYDAINIDYTINNIDL